MQPAKEGRHGLIATAQELAQQSKHMHIHSWTASALSKCRLSGVHLLLCSSHFRSVKVIGRNHRPHQMAVPSSIQTANNFCDLTSQNHDMTMRDAVVENPGNFNHAGFSNVHRHCTVHGPLAFHVRQNAARLRPSGQQSDAIATRPPWQTILTAEVRHMHGLLCRMPSTSCQITVQVKYQTVKNPRPGIQEVMGSRSVLWLNGIPLSSSHNTCHILPH